MSNPRYPEEFNQVTEKKLPVADVAARLISVITAPTRHVSSC